MYKSVKDYNRKVNDFSKFEFSSPKHLASINDSDTKTNISNYLKF